MGLALRDEIAELEAAGIKVIQVDEPALRELLPLRKADQAGYLDWSIGSFRLATAGAADATQIHTHLCYSEFGVIIDAIDGLDADVTSIEAARSRLEGVQAQHPVVGWVCRNLEKRVNGRSHHVTGRCRLPLHPPRADCKPHG